MIHSKLRLFLIKCDDSPVKVLSLQPHLVRRFMQKLSSQYGTHHWSVTDRFPTTGAD